MIVAATACPCCARSLWFETCAGNARRLTKDAPMTTMNEAEWNRTRWLRRDLVRVVGLMRWYEMSVEACDAAVRDAEARGVEAAAEGVRER